MDAGPLKDAALLLAGTLLLSLAFAGSYVGALHDPRPHGLPVAVVGPEAAAQVRVQAGDALDVRSVASRDAALQAIDDRDVYGALVPGERLLVASAAGAAAAEALTAAVQRSGQRVEIEDVKPLPADDARGISPFYLVVGWVVAGYLGATVIGLARGMRITGRRLAALRVGALAVYALLTGILGAVLIDGVIGALGGHFIGLALIGALVVFATAAAAGALQALLGIVGTGIVLLLFVVLGNPGSGGPYARELLPGLWRDTGPYLTPGAGTDAVRNLVYFDGSALGRPLLVLAAYAIAGAAVMIAAGHIARSTSPREVAGAAALGA